MANSNELAAWRKAQGYTQQALAQLLGRDHKSVSAYETGRNQIPDEVGKALRELGYDGPLTFSAKPLKTLAKSDFSSLFAASEAILKEIETEEKAPIPPVLRSELLRLVGEEIEDAIQRGKPDAAREKVLRWWKLVQRKRS